MMEISPRLSEVEKNKSIDELLDERNRLSTEFYSLKGQFVSATENQTNSIRHENYTQIKINTAKRITELEKEIKKIDDRMREIQGIKKVS
jgi:hypothetical protein